MTFSPNLGISSFLRSEGIHVKIVVINGNLEHAMGSIAETGDVGPVVEAAVDGDGAGSRRNFATLCGDGDVLDEHLGTGRVAAEVKDESDVVGCDTGEFVLDHDGLLGLQIHTTPLMDGGTLALGVAGIIRLEIGEGVHIGIRGEREGDLVGLICLEGDEVAFTREDEELVLPRIGGRLFVGQLIGGLGLGHERNLGGDGILTIPVSARAVIVVVHLIAVSDLPEVGGSIESIARGVIPIHRLRRRDCITLGQDDVLDEHLGVGRDAAEVDQEALRSDNRSEILGLEFRNLTLRKAGAGNLEAAGTVLALLVEFQEDRGLLGSVDLAGEAVLLGSVEKQLVGRVDPHLGLPIAAGRNLVPDFIRRLVELRCRSLLLTSPIRIVVPFEGVGGVDSLPEVVVGRIFSARGVVPVDLRLFGFLTGIRLTDLHDAGELGSLTGVRQEAEGGPAAVDDVETDVEGHGQTTREAVIIEAQLIEAAFAGTFAGRRPAGLGPGPRVLGRAVPLVERGAVGDKGTGVGDLAFRHIVDRAVGPVLGEGTRVVRIEVDVETDLAVSDGFVGDLDKDIELVGIVKFGALEAGHGGVGRELEAYHVLGIEGGPFFRVTVDLHGVVVRGLGEVRDLGKSGVLGEDHDGFLGLEIVKVIEAGLANLEVATVLFGLHRNTDFAGSGATVDVPGFVLAELELVGLGEADVLQHEGTVGFCADIVSVFAATPAGFEERTDDGPYGSALDGTRIVVLCRDLHRTGGREFQHGGGDGRLTGGQSGHLALGNGSDFRVGGGPVGLRLFGGILRGVLHREGGFIPDEHVERRGAEGDTLQVDGRLFIFFVRTGHCGSQR